MLTDCTRQGELICALENSRTKGFIVVMDGLYGVLPPLSNSWIIFIVYVYIVPNMTPSIDCYWVGAVSKGFTR